MKSLSLLLAAALLAAGAAQAAPLQVQASGTFDDTVSSSFFTAPGAAWSVSFVVDSDPAPLLNDGLTVSGLFTTVPFSQFSYTLGGVPIAQPATFVSLYASTNGGGIDIFFSDLLDPLAPLDALSLFGPQVYTGDETAPTLVPGIYDITGVTATVGGLGTDQAPVRLSITAIGQVPLPGSLALALAAGLPLAATRRRRRPLPA